MPGTQTVEPTDEPFSRISQERVEFTCIGRRPPIWSPPGGGDGVLLEFSKVKRYPGTLEAPGRRVPSFNNGSGRRSGSSLICRMWLISTSRSTTPVLQREAKSWWQVIHHGTCGLDLCSYRTRLRTDAFKCAPTGSGFLQKEQSSGAQTIFTAVIPLRIDGGCLGTTM